MAIFKRIQINKWKQFENVDISFDGRITVLTGANGAGKTTILNILAKHFGWNVVEIATPVKDEETGIFGFLNRMFKKKKLSDEQTIGDLEYSSNQHCQITVPLNSNTATYNIGFTNQLGLTGINIPAHRPVYNYINVPNIATAKRTKKQAYELSKNSYHASFLGNGGQKQNYFIKETLLNWAIAGDGNQFIQSDKELIDNFIGFQEILKKVLPESIGFQKISIRNYEIVLETNTGDFLIDAVSGGVSSIIDLSWLVYTFVIENSSNNIVLIDEIENHLHPTLQRSILPSFLEAFPDTQFIISTHSPLVVGSVKSARTYILTYNTENRVESIYLDFKNQGRTANEILNSVLGLETTIPIWVEKELNKIVEKYSKDEIKESTFNDLRIELKNIGMESLVPKTINKILDEKND